MLIEKLTHIIDFNPLIQPDCLITGGHFIIGQDAPPTLNRGTIASFRQAVTVYEQAKREGVKVHLGIFINDIGLTCESAMACSITSPRISKDNFSLPPVYQAILEEYCVDESELKIFWERHIRNRGAKLFRHWKKQESLIEKDELGYWLADPELYGRIILCRHSGVPSCPLIMAALIDEQVRQGYTASLNFYYIGLDNTGNIPNHFVVEKGKRALELLNHPVDVKNIYFSDDSVLGNFNA